jgi:hypothetical protein
LLIRPFPQADRCIEKVLKILTRKKENNKNLVLRRMDMLTNDEALLSVWRGAVTATAEKSSLDAIPGGDNKADILTPQVGAHGS